MDRSKQGNASPEDHELELTLPNLLFTKTVRELYAKIVNEWDFLRKSACQTAAARALWKHVIHDPLAHVLAGETYLINLHEKIKKDRHNNAREISGVILAVRTLWFDSKIEAVVDSLGGAAQVVLLGAGMDLRAYRLSCLKESDVFEVDFPEVLQVKAALLEETLESTEHLWLMEKSLTRVAADIRENDWVEKLQTSGFVPEKNTVWILEGIIYYLSNSQAMQVLKIVGEKCTLTHSSLSRFHEQSINNALKCYFPFLQ
ncbi:hypothetical protein F3Y22_tig00111210pilonHSYRG00386 [Hibiscus syriacus]|uniref:S-adenosyl-L-methionine-dependent methyltransferase n=1 Tax=Hibiscus syriacus TaxID=106335 RepID=A0A6A2YVI2_HIBSY|nr:hypothetical protein F3Y22_tig00111210pilonHSYRG00386 [Hibiscus syriacus]